MVIYIALKFALKFLDNESTSEVLSLIPDILAELEQKHPETEPIADNGLLYGPIEHIPSFFFDNINETTILKAVLNTKGSAGPSGRDAELYRRLLASKTFSNAGKEMREEIAILIKNLLTKSYHPCLLEPLLASRLIPLNKNPGVRPIGVGEVLRRIIGKVVSRNSTEEIKAAAGPLQTCAGHEAGAEAAIHAMKEKDETDAVILIDASNVFNRMNRTTAIHNIQILCPNIAMFIVNTQCRREWGGSGGA